MGWASRLLSVALALLLVLAGGIVDLCACDATAHGARCSASAAATPARASRATTARSCCDDPARDADGGPRESGASSDGPTVRSPGCDCPVLVFDTSPSESEPTVRDSPRAGALGHELARAPLAGVAGDAPTSRGWWPARHAAELRAPPLRRNLELHVLRL